MARNLTARAESIVTLNGKAAEATLDALKTKAKGLRSAIDEASKAGDATQVKKLTAELKATDNAMRNIRQTTYDYNQVLKNLNGSSLNDLQKTAKLLRNEMKLLGGDTKEFAEKSKQLDVVSNRINQLNGRTKETHSWLSRAGNSFNKYWGLATTAIASITGLSFALRGAAQQAAKMDDTYSDVMKTTGLLREDVVWLNEEFKTFNTRTSREELNMLARDAGKLGISAKTDILQFVKATNQINVALGEDLGEGAIRNIGKISEVFQKTKEMGVEKAYLSIGSAINALGQDSTASEQYLVDFTQRIAGSAYQAGISLQNVLGWASALDQTGNQVEMSATAFQKFLMQLYSEPAKFAELAKLDVAEFTTLLNTDANAAIIKVLTSLREKGGFAALVPVFQDMGLDGARAVAVLTSLANNIGLVTKAQKLSNIEFTKASSLTNEYNVKNNNMQAQLDKAKKAFLDRVILFGEKLTPALLKTTNATTLVLKLLMEIPSWIYAFIAAGGAAVVIIKSWNIVMGVWNTLMTGARLVSLFTAAAMAKLQGETVRAAAAWKMFNASFSATAIGAIVTAIAALGYGLYKVFTYQSDLTKATKSYYAEVEKAKSEAFRLLDVLNNSEKGTNTYKAALEKLQELYGPYINSLISEKGVLTDIAAARNLIVNAIYQTIGARIKEQALSDTISKSLEKQSDYYEKIVNTLKNQGKLSEEVARVEASNFADAVKNGANWSTLVNNLAKKYGNNIFIGPFKTFANEYKDMVDDVAKINDRFSFIASAAKITQTEIIGPPKPTKEQLDAAAKAAAEAAAKVAEERKKQLEKAFRDELSIIDNQEKEKQNFWKKSLIEGNITQSEYEIYSNATTDSFLLTRIALFKKYNQETADVESQLYDSMLKQADRLPQIYEQIEQHIEEARKRAVAKDEKEVENDPENKELDAILEKVKKHQSELKTFSESVKKDFLSSKKSQYQQEIEMLKEALDEKLITEEEYASKRKELNLKNAIEVGETISSALNQAASFMDSLKDSQYSRLETQKEKELALYGDTADARAAIEQKYEQKKLELEKKYADIDMGIKIAQAISSGAVAAMKAWEAGPFIGPVLAGIIAATTVAQVAAIVAQRNAIKSSTVDTSSSYSTGKTSRTVNDGYSGGGFTRKSYSDYTPVGVVHANEWVAPASMVRANPVFFATLDRERINRFSAGTMTKGFASGGFTSSSTVTNTTADPNLITLLVSLLQELDRLKNTPLKSYVVIDELNAVQELLTKFKKEGSL
jgi:TP901 family phage tail tape measure protein